MVTWARIQFLLFVFRFLYSSISIISYYVYLWYLWGFILVLFKLIDECTYWVYGGLVRFRLVVLIYTFSMLIFSVFMRFDLYLSLNSIISYYLYLSSTVSLGCLPSTFFVLLLHCASIS